MTESAKSNSNVEKRPGSGNAFLRLFSGDDSALRRLRLQTYLTITVERFWPLVLPLVLIVAHFASLSWFGLFASISGWLHLVLLGLFAIAGIASLLLLLRFQAPTNEEITKRIEQDNGLAHEPLLIQTKQSVANPTDPYTMALWREHQRRMAERLKNLRAGSPRPRIPERDPFGVRAVVALLFVTAFAYSFSPHSGSITDALNINLSGSPSLTRVDAWVTPPNYTGRAPVYLSGLNQSGQADQAQPAQTETAITIPQGSILNVRVIGGRSEKMSFTNADGSKSSIAPLQKAKDGETEVVDDNSRSFRFDLQQTGKVNLSGANLQWAFNVTPDNPPQIKFTKDPGQTFNGTLQLSYSLEDDYGVVKAYAEIYPQDIDHEEASPLYDAPEVNLTLPRRGSKEAKTDKDITEHPWAGQEVSMTLVAVDALGHEARSETKTVRLPTKPFGNPLARAIVEQRSILALDSSQRDVVLDMLSALLLRPEETIKNTAHFLGISTIKSRLRIARSDDDLRDTADYMWQVALGIENGNLSAAEKKLRQAQQALKDALERNASPEEISKLTAELRKAMQDYLREFAQRQRENPNAQRRQPNPNARVMTQKDLERMLDQIEQLGQTGSKEQAQELLSQLQEMLNNLQPGQNQAGQQGGQSQNQRMQQQMNKLGDLMRRQQQTMNETFQLDQKMQRQLYDNESQGGGTENGEQQGNQSDLADQMRKLQEQQKQLQSELDKLTEELKQQGIEPSKDFSDANRSMGDAADSLGQNESGAANDQQGKALQSLRQASRDMMKKMQEAMQGGQQGQEGQQQSGRDPLGRPSGDGLSGEDGRDRVPKGADIQRAREILDEIRRRLGKALTPELEKEYLQRLLKFDD